jgi:hypothetical protein
MVCDYLGEFIEKMEQFVASCYIDWFVSAGIKKCEFLRLPFEREFMNRCSVNSLKLRKSETSIFTSVG